MNYEQRYKEALKAVKELQEANPSDDGIQNWVNENFHELAKSEDDNEKISAMLIRHIRQERGSLSNDEVTEAIAWIEKQAKKSSKWSEEDEKNLRRAIRATKVVYPETADWLKSIGNRITWKVSDAQMQALKKACDKHCEPDGLDPLYTLYEEFKKLKGE